MSLLIEQGDITKYEVDAIVNAANSTLLGGGGVDGAIHRAAGPDLLAECRTLGGCATGQAKITKGYNLKAKFVVHTVGPIYYTVDKKQAEMFLNACYKNSIKLALEKGCKSIAFPLISAGVYGYPKNEAIEIAVSNIQKYAGDLEVFLVLFDKEAFEIARNLYPEFLPQATKEEKQNIELFIKYYGYDRYSQKPDWHEYKVYHIWKKSQEGAFIGYPEYALELNGELRLASPEEAREIMGSKFIYTAEDVKGCTLQSPDYSQCLDCVYNYDDKPLKCLIYEDIKPSAVLFDKKPCERKRVE